MALISFFPINLFMEGGNSMSRRTQPRGCLTHQLAALQRNIAAHFFDIDRRVQERVLRNFDVTLNYDDHVVVSISLKLAHQPVNPRVVSKNWYCLNCGRVEQVPNLHRQILGQWFNWSARLLCADCAQSSQHWRVRRHCQLCGNEFCSTTTVLTERFCPRHQHWWRND